MINDKRNDTKILCIPRAFNLAILRPSIRKDKLIPQN